MTSLATKTHRRRRSQGLPPAWELMRKSSPRNRRDPTAQHPPAGTTAARDDAVAGMGGALEGLSAEAVRLGCVPTTARACDARRVSELFADMLLGGQPNSLGPAGGGAGGRH